MTHDILRRLPEILPREADSVFKRYIDAHNEELDNLDTRIDDTITAHQVDQATGKDLDRIGAMFGELGARRGRSDADYRAFLRSVVRSFNGRGSVDGLKFAVAAAIEGDTSNVVIEEDFQNLEYNIIITGIDTVNISTAINDLAELADPSAVNLNENIINADGEELLLSAGVSTSTKSDGLGAGILDMDGTQTLG